MTLENVRSAYAVDTGSVARTARRLCIIGKAAELQEFRAPIAVVGTSTEAFFHIAVQTRYSAFICESSDSGDNIR